MWYVTYVTDSETHYHTSCTFLARFSHAIRFVQYDTFLALCGTLLVRYNTLLTRYGTIRHASCTIRYVFYTRSYGLYGFCTILIYFVTIDDKHYFFFYILFTLISKDWIRIITILNKYIDKDNLRLISAQ